MNRVNRLAVFYNEKQVGTLALYKEQFAAHDVMKNNLERYAN